MTPLLLPTFIFTVSHITLADRTNGLEITPMRPSSLEKAAGSAPMPSCSRDPLLVTAALSAQALLSIALFLPMNYGAEIRPDVSESSNHSPLETSDV